MPVSHSGFAVCATVHNPAYVIPSRAAAKCCRVKKSQDGLLCDFFFLFTGRIKNICDGRLFTNPRVGGCNCPLSSIIYSYTSVTGLKRLQKGRLIGWNLKMQSEPFDLCSKQKRLCTSQTETGKFIQCFLEHDVQCWYGLADYIFSQLRWLKALFMRITAYASQHQPRKLSTSFFFFFPSLFPLLMHLGLFLSCFSVISQALPCLNSVYSFPSRPLGSDASACTGLKPVQVEGGDRSRRRRVH